MSMSTYSPQSGGASPARVDTADQIRSTIRTALAHLFEPGQVVELRIPNVEGRGNRTDSGYYDDFDELAKRAAAYSGRAAGVYCTLNPVQPALLARSYNRVTEYAKLTTSDADIVRRRYVPVDCDPVRPAGISSSDEEHAAALLRVEAIRDHLRGEGWPDPIYADSGNGGHLLYRVDLPAKDGGTVERILQKLAAQFDDDVVKVDRSVHNPARIWKVYGTLARKGDSIPGRPHRTARILAVPR